MMKKRILVIDDEEEILDNIRSLLELEHYETLIANSGEQGISIARQLLPDLILCDVTMPGIDGYEVIHRLQGFEETRSIPFIFLTARADHQDLRNGMSLGADDYLAKPYKRVDLLSAIKTRLDKFHAIKTAGAHAGEHGRSSGQKRLGHNDSIIIPHQNLSIPVKIKAIRYITADNQYTRIVLEDHRRFVMRKSLAYWDKILPVNAFIRIHRSTIINLDSVDRFEKTPHGAYKVFLKHHTVPFDVSRRYSKGLKTPL